MNRIIFASLTIILTFLSIATLNNSVRAHSQESYQAEEKSTLPEIVSTPDEFAPEGWSVVNVVKGDLNGDGIADAAIVIEQNTENPPGEILLVVALQGKDGKLHRSLVGDGKDLNTHYDKEEQLEVYINEGVLIVDNTFHLGKEIREIKRYHYEHDQWGTIGVKTDLSRRHKAPVYYSKDYNLMTGFIREITKANPPKSYYQLRATKVNNTPVIDGNLSTNEWPGLSVNLQDSSNVVQGRTVWQGIADLSAKLGAVVHGDNLYLRAEVTDDQVTDGDQLQLVSNTGQIIKPVESKKQVAEHGYVVEARYQLKDLVADKVQNAQLRLSVEIVDVDNSPKQTTKIISTSCGGRKYAARILPTPYASLPPIDSQE